MGAVAFGGDQVVPWPFLALRVTRKDASKDSPARSRLAEEWTGDSN